MLPRLAGCCRADVVAVDAGRRRRRCRRRHGSPVDNVVVSAARWGRHSLGHQIQILQTIIYCDAVAVNDLEPWRYSSAVSLPVTHKKKKEKNMHK